MYYLQIALSMAAYLAIILLLGAYFFKSNNSSADYFLGGRTIGPWVCAISAEASDMSGWLLMGLPGLAYATGSGIAIWTAIGLAAGTFFNWHFVSKRIRTYSEVCGNAITLPQFFTNRFRDEKRTLSIIAAFFIVIFFTLYTASGFVAAGKLFTGIFDIDYITVMLISAFVIVLYTVIGGFLAVSFSDLIQGILMFFSILIVLALGLSAAGGIAPVVSMAKEIPSFTSLFYYDNNGVSTPFSPIGIISELAWGLGYCGMPHILVRFMAVRSPKELKRSKTIAMVWVLISLFAALAIGIVGRALFFTPEFDSEQIFIKMTLKLLPPILAGVVLSGVLAAAMSTADSQLLVTASAITEDIVRPAFKDISAKKLVWLGRLVVIGIALVACVLALDPTSSVFKIVSNAWAGFGAAFGPMVVLSLYWKRITKNGALAGMITGGGSIIILVLLKTIAGKGSFTIPQSVLLSLPQALTDPTGLYNTLLSTYELLWGFILATIAIVVTSLLDKEPAKDVVEEFDKVVAML